jgi:hypothetical protein
MLIFRSKFENFWRDPQSVPVIWIGLLFSILCLTTYFEIASNQKVPVSKVLALRNPMDIIKIFREKTVQCLVLSNYTNPTTYTVETLFLYYISERKSMLVFSNCSFISMISLSPSNHFVSSSEDARAEKLS